MTVKEFYEYCKKEGAENAHLMSFDSDDNPCDYITENELKERIDAMYVTEKGEKYLYLV